ncbi:hypothetical protein HMPREF1639_00810 [Peptostreptococcus sp. MV1]|nr:hypothetical protein HMPREF1639_00810 [Peptostreptococcus sp. MV1]
MARKISLMGILLAFNAIIYILVNYIPTNTIALLVLAGLPAMIVVVEFGLRDACLYVLAGLILAFVLINNKLHFVTYLLTFSSYPLVKALVENVKSFKIQLGLKLLYANLALLVLYLVYKQFVVIDKLVMDYIPLALLVYNLAFLVYDRAMSQFIIYYIDKLSKIIRKR